MGSSTCPEAVYGTHGEADRDGRCPYCRAKVGAKMMRPGMDWRERQRLERERDPLRLEPLEDDYYDL